MCIVRVYIYIYIYIYICFARGVKIKGLFKIQGFLKLLHI